jgi:hypothetical protein
VKSEGKTSNGGPKPDGIKDVGSVLNSEKCIIVVCKDNPVTGKADAMNAVEGSRPGIDKAREQVTTGV